MALNRNFEQIESWLRQAEKTLTYYERRLNHLLHDSESGKKITFVRIKQEEESVIRFQEIKRELELQLSVPCCSMVNGAIEYQL